MNGKKYARKVEGGKPIEHCQCVRCGKSFKTEQGKGNHERTCDAAQTHCKELREKELEGNEVFSTSCSSSTTFTHPPTKKSRANEHQERHNRATNNFVIMLPAETENAANDGRKSNRSSSKRTSIDNEHKASLIEFYERSGLAVAEFVKKHSLSTKHNKNLSEGASGWRNPARKSIILKMATDAKHKKCKHSAAGVNFKKSPYAITENDVCKRILEHRKKGRKVSMNFVRIAARSRMIELQPDMANAFKASEGWFYRFAKRKNIKFRKMKSGKKYDGEANLDKITKVNVFL